MKKSKPKSSRGHNKFSPSDDKQKKSRGGVEKSTGQGRIKY
jgi:hypothetical protein